MVQIFSNTKFESIEYIYLTNDDSDFDFLKAKDEAKKTALTTSDFPMILSWKNSKTGESYPDYECGENKKPFWIRYAEGRGANLVIDFNEGEYIFMILKI